MNTRSVLGVVVVVVGTARADVVRADPAPAVSAPAEAPPPKPGPPAFTIGATPTWVLLGGLTTGGTVALADRGAFVGGEVSLALLRDGNHVGFYTDAYYDWGASGTYVTGGVEIGHKFFGLDGGVAVRIADGDHAIGQTVRASVGLGVASLFVRYAHFGKANATTVSAAMADDNVLQVGLLLKLPFTTIPTGGR